MPAVSPQSLLRNPRVPTLPAIAVQVLELARNEQTDLRELAQLIENDQALAVKVLRTVNSSYYGLARPCPTITQAIIYLGTDAVQSLALGFSLVSCVDGGGEQDVTFDYIDYWRRAIYAAAASRLIAGATHQCDPDEAFLAALVQDLGMIVLDRSLGDAYLQAIDLTGGDHEKLVAVERHSLEIDHATVGGDLAERWNMPPRIAEAIRFHHDPSPPADIEQLVRTLALARRAAALALPTPPAGALHSFMRHARAIGFAPAEVRDLLERMAAAAADLAWLLQVDLGPTPDIEVLLDRAEAMRVERNVQTVRENESLRRILRTAGPPPVDEEAGLEREIQRAAAGAASVALILCEVDGADAIAETHGQGATASLMLKVQGMLRLGSCAPVLRTSDAGFAMVLPEAGDLDAARLAESLRSRLAAAPLNLCSGNTSAGSITVTASVGAAVQSVAPRDGSIDAASLLRLASQALQAAKTAGGNTVRLSPTAGRSSRAA